jgi:hypothetical protein
LPSFTTPLLCYSAITLILGSLAFGQTPPDPPETQPQPATAPQPVEAQPDPAEAQQQQDKRIFGVLPNYRTVEDSRPFSPITPKQKFTIAVKDSFDYPVYLISGAFAGLYQLDDQNPSYGQGLKGYGKRYGAAYGDQAIGNIMTEGLFPTLLHEDPRYFRRGTGGKWSRTRYALTRVIVSRNDKGNWGFNYSEWLGNGVAVAISNLYYPTDTRDLSDNLEKWGVQVATDAFSNVLKEFWPDVKRKLHRHSAPKP